MIELIFTENAGVILQWIVCLSCHLGIMYIMSCIQCRCFWKQMVMLLHILWTGLASNFYFLFCFTLVTKFYDSGELAWTFREIPWKFMLKMKCFILMGEKSFYFWVKLSVSEQRIGLWMSILKELIKMSLIPSLAHNQHQNH